MEKYLLRSRPLRHVLENGLALWVTGYQLWKGAALNAIQIAELLHNKGRIGKGA